MTAHFLGTPKKINGDLVVGVVSMSSQEDFSYSDEASIQNWLTGTGKCNAAGDPTTKYLGVLDIAENVGAVHIPSLKNLVSEGARMTVNGMNGTMTYDLPVVQDKGNETVEDTSAEAGSTAGIYGSAFPIVLKQPLKPGDTITYDVYGDDFLLVSGEYQIEPTGTGYRHMVKVISHDETKTFPSEQLVAGVQYFKTNHAMGEFSTQYSGIESMEASGHIRCEFKLGNHRAVEASYTRYADMISGNIDVKGDKIQGSFSGHDFFNRVKANAASRYGDEIMNNSLKVVVGKQAPDGSIAFDGSQRIGDIIPTLVMAELLKLEAISLNFMKGGMVNDGQNRILINDGKYQQDRMGTVLNYSRPGHITVQDLARVSNVIYQGSHVGMEDRRLHLNAGYMAFTNIITLIQEHSFKNLEYTAPFTGTDSQLPKPVISGTDLDNLSVENIKFTEAFLPGVGKVTVEHDPSLDFEMGVDSHVSGMNGTGYGRRSYSVEITDKTSRTVSNARAKLPNEASLVKDGSEYADYYLVTPNGFETVRWGTEDRRYDRNNGAGSRSIGGAQGSTVWAENASAIWKRDVGKTVILEVGAGTWRG